jgi:hypothetical protein
MRSLGVLLVSLTALIAGCSEQFEWRDVRSADGYTVALPGRAQTATREIELDGQKFRLSMTSTGIGPALFAVGAAQLPATLTADAAVRDRTIAYFRDSLLRNIEGKVTHTAPAPLALAPASGMTVLATQEVRATGISNGRSSTLAARFFIIDDRFFEVIALGAGGGVAPEALDTFFTSFRPQP